MMGVLKYCQITARIEIVIVPCNHTPFINARLGRVENAICLSGNLAFPSHDRPGAMVLSPLIPDVRISYISTVAYMFLFYRLHLTLTFPPIYLFFPRALENRFSDPLNTPQRL